MRWAGKRSTAHPKTTTPKKSWRKPGPIPPARDVEVSEISEDLNRAEEVKFEKYPLTVTLPVREFMFTIDQVAYMLHVSIEHASNYFIYFDGLSPGGARNQLVAINVQQDLNQSPDWRIAESDFLAWIRRIGFRPGNRKIITRPA